MENLTGMDLDDDTYQDIIDKVGAEIYEILKGMKKDREMKKCINDMYKGGALEEEDVDELPEQDLAELEHDSPIQEYYIQDSSEKSKRLANSSEHSYVNPKSQ